MPRSDEALNAALGDLADFERRIVLMEPDRHRLREIAEMFEASGWFADAVVCFRLAGDSNAADVLQAGMAANQSSRRRPPARTPHRTVPFGSELTLRERITRAFADGGDSAAARCLADLLSEALVGGPFPAETVLQMGAAVEGRNGPLPAMRAEIAAGLLCIGEDLSAYQILRTEISREAPLLRAQKLMADWYESRSKRGEALAIYEQMAARQLSYPGVQSGLARLRDRTGHPERYRPSGPLPSAKGKGGTRVFSARDLHLHRDVVIKRSEGLKIGARFGHETAIIARIAHPSVVQVLDAEPSSSQIVFECLEGDLTGVDEAGRILSRERGQWRGVADAVAALHQMGWVHGRIDSSHLLWGHDRGIVLGGWAEASEDIAKAPDDVKGLGAAIEAACRESADPELMHLLARCSLTERAARPTARALARAL